MRFRTLGAITAALLLATAVPVAAMPGGNGNHGPKSCDPAELAAAQDAVMQACPCDTAVNHGQYVSCVVHEVIQLIRDGSLTKACRRQARKGVAVSTCGKPGFVTCCRSGACSVKRTAATCEALGGTVGTTAMCADACVASPSGAFLDPSASLF